MSLGPITQHEWLNRNSLRAFPVEEGSALKFNTGEEMPNTILVDIYLVASIPGPSRIHVSAVSFTMRTVTVVLAESETGSSVGYATVILGKTPPNSSVPIRSHDGRGTGSISFGRILDPAIHVDYGDFLGVHNQDAGTKVDQRCYICTGKPILESMRVDLQDGQIQGGAILSLGRELKAEITELIINGVKETQVELSLIDPEEFLPDCYPKYIDSLCYCDQRPIATVNGVPRDEDGDLGIDIVFGNNLDGEITNLVDENLLNLIIDKPGNEICVEEPIIPDTYGRLGPTFSADCPPSVAYGAPSGPPCSNPPIRPPLP